MTSFLTIIHVVTCILLVLVVMIQSGKGAEISASFGGSSQTVFGSSGGANFFVKFTSVAAAIFMATSLTLTVLGARSSKSLFEGLPAASAPAKPAGTSAAPVGGQPNAAPVGAAAAPGAPAASAPVAPAPAPVKPAAPAATK